MDIKNVPSSLVDEIAPILGVANEIQSDNPRVSYICRFYALERAHTLDPISSGYRVRQFKDALLLHLERENKATSRGERNSDAHVIQAFYLHFNRNYMHSLQNADKVDRIRVAKDYQKASVLFEAMKAVSLSDSIEVPNEILEAHAEMYIHNMLTLHPESSNQTREKLPEILEAQMKQTNHHKIPLQTIKDCTQEFDEKNLIGNGGYGRVYKGILSWAHVNKLVAVKRLDVTGFQGNKEFHTEVSMLSQYQHKNIITLIGFCDDNKEMILVYEYASNGSLDTYLRDTTMSGGLSWPQLLNICIGVASALNYLHNHVAEKHRIIHRDIKSANVLLDENWNAKLSDFGLARIGLAHQQNTIGFLSKESDVYSFGVVLFEVLCGRLECVFSYHDERRFLHHLARTRYKNGELGKIINHRIKKDIKPRTLSKFSAIAYQCLHETREQRPTIAEVVFQFKEARETQLGDEEDEFLFRG